MLLTSGHRRSRRHIRNGDDVEDEKCDDSDDIDDDADDKTSKYNGKVDDKKQHTQCEKSENT